jgi:maltose O-acetyltransferase
MLAGEWYSCLVPELDAMRDRARAAVHEHNTMPPEERGHLGPKLAALFRRIGEGVFLEAPFHCSYGVHTELGDGVYMNAGCVIRDSAPVRIGKGTMLGPSVQVYCPEHHRDPVKRSAGLEIAKPVTIGENVWIGGAAVILGGVTIGDGAIVGAGSVVRKSVPAASVVAGNPARSIGRVDLKAWNG